MNRTVRLLLAAVLLTAFMLGVMIAMAGNLGPVEPKGPKVDIGTAECVVRSGEAILTCNPPSVTR